MSESGDMFKKYITWVLNQILVELQILRDVSQRYQHQQKHSAQDQASEIFTIVE